MQWSPRTLRLTSLAVLFLAVAALAQTVQPPEAPTNSELRVRVTYLNDQAVGVGIRVELVNSSGLAINQIFTDELGQATFSPLRPGYYSLKVTGATVEDVATPNFHIVRGEGVHYEYVRVPAKSSAGLVTTESGPPISALELNAPDGARKEYDAGMAALNLKNWPEAKAHFEKALQIYPQHAKASNGLGVVLMNTGDPVRGRQAFEAALRLDGHLPSAALNLAVIAYKGKRYAEAEELLNRCLTGDPMNQEALLYLANTQLLLGQSEEAVSTARRLHNLDHADYTIVHVIAAQALVNLKRPDEAASEYQLYLQESPAGPAAGRARAGLQALQSPTPH
jgi:Flp pilus assembly protein TadD